MLCDRCYGTGWADKSFFWEQTVVCPNCGGVGRVHCCEGDKEQPEKEEQDDG